MCCFVICQFLLSFYTTKAPIIQQIALATKQTYNYRDAPDVDYIASLGSYGTEEHNVARELINKFCKTQKNPLPLPFTVSLPVLEKIAAECEKRMEMRDFNMYLPHDWFAMEAPPYILQKVFGLRDVAMFWEGHNLADPKLFQNIIMETHGATLSTFIPLSLHGDGGAFSKNDSLMVISMRSITSAANVAHSQLFLAGVPKACMNRSSNPAQDTMTCLWKVLAWSFSAVFSGKHPELDHRGQLWTDKYRMLKAGTSLTPKNYKGCIFALTGDFEYFQNELKIRCYSFTECCWLCPASKTNPEFPFNDFRAEAAWRTTCHSPAFHRANKPSSHVIWTIPGVVAESIHVDSLHCNEEGTAAHTLANVLFDHVVGREWDGTQDAK